MAFDRLRRALLFMPGDDLHKIEKAAALSVDSIIMDLEDGVALSKKQAGRETIVHALKTLDFGGKERLIRINPVSSPFYQDDLTGTIDGHPDGYVMPKVESGKEIQLVSQWLAKAEEQAGWPMGSIRLLAIIESAMGIVNLREIASAGDRLVALIFGAEDFASSVGAIRTTAGIEVLYARSAAVTYAAAYELQAIDTPFVNLRDDEGLVDDTTYAMHMGYSGKLAIHPRQVDLITQIFNPTEQAVAYAVRVLEANKAQQGSGTGVFELDGKMIDMPMVRAAETVVARAKAAGLLPG